MTSEGGGKFRQKRTRSAKPYERPKSILNKVGDVVRGILTPSSWVSYFSQSAVDEVEVGGSLLADGMDCNSNAVLTVASRSALNSAAGPSGATVFPSPRPSNLNRQTLKHRIQVGSTPLWNPAELDEDHRRVPSVEPSDEPTASTSFLPSLDGTLDSVSEPSTSNPFVSPNSVASLGARSWQSRQKGERANGRTPSVPAASASSRKTFARLRDIGKLSNDVSAKASNQDADGLANLADDTQSECSEESVSTSGCSSMIPHPDKREYQKEILQLSKPALQQLSTNLQVGFSAKTGSSTGNWDGSQNATAHHSIERPSSFLWSENSQKQHARPQPIPVSNKPQFNSFLFGSPASMEKPAIEVKNHISPASFNNQVGYGFGSAHRRSTLGVTAPYSTYSSNRRRIQVKSAKTGDLDIMSTTAKRILETLEKMSTPLMDAKRIPTSKPESDLPTPLTFTTSSYRRRPNLSAKNVSVVNKVEATNSSVPQGPPVTRLLTPGSVTAPRTYLRNSEEAPCNATGVTRVNSRSDNGPSARSKTQAAPSRDDCRSSGGKMKGSHSSGLHYSSKASAEDDVLEVANWPCVPLPIQTLPKFDFFGSNAEAKSSSSSLSAPPVATSSPTSVPGPFSMPSKDPPSVSAAAASSQTAPCKPEADDVAKFQFSTPIVKKAIDSAMHSLRNQSPAQFTFSSPLSITEEASNEVGGSLAKTTKSTVPTSHDDSVKSVNFEFKSPSPAKLPLKLKSPGKKQPESTDNSKPAGKSSVSSELKSGSVMDILSKPKSIDLKSEAKSGGFAGSSAFGKLPTSKTLDKQSASSTLGFGDKFCPPAGNWNCKVCLVNNKMDDLKCVACNAAKPSKSKPPANTTNAVVPATFGDQFRPATNTWECPSCMLRVKEEMSKCPACEASKPSSKPAPSESAAATSASKPSISVGAVTTSQPLSDKFRLAGGMWECDTCMVRNSAGSSKCIACESLKPGSSTTVAPGNFKFTLTTSSSSSAAPFKFGFSSAESPVTTSGTTLLSSAQSVSSFKFGLPVATAAAAVAQTTASAITTTAAPSIGVSSALNVTSTFATPSLTSTFKFGFVESAGEAKSAKSAQPAGGLAVNATSKSITATGGVTGLVSSSDMPASDEKPRSAPEVSGDPQVVEAKIPKLSDVGGNPTPSFKFGMGSNSAPLIPVATSEAHSAEKLSVATVNEGTPHPTFSFGKLKPTTANPPSGFSFGNSSNTAVAPAVATSLQPASGGFTFKFGAASDATKASPLPSLPATTASGTPPMFSFGNTTAEASKAKAPTSSIPASVPSAAAAAVSGGFQFSFGSSSRATTGVKREASSDDEKVPMKIAASAAASGLPSFGLFPRGGATLSQTASAPGGFSFGMPASNSAPSGPIFGALSTTSEKSLSSSTFTFGASPSNVNNSSGNSNASPALPTFGSTSSNTNVFGASVNAAPLRFGAPLTTQPLSSTFSFGSAAPAASTASTFPTFTFGSQNTLNKSNGPAASMSTFGSVAPAPSTTPAFGAGLRPSAPLFSSQAATPAPTFGGFGSAPSAAGLGQGFGGTNGVNAATPAAGFNFGSTPNFQFGSSTMLDSGVYTFTGNQAQPPATGFSFVQQANPTAAPSSGFNFNPPGQVSFNFGVGPDGSNQPPTFSASQNPFDVHGPAGARPGRVIKKAKRRTK